MRRDEKKIEKHPFCQFLAVCVLLLVCCKAGVLLTELQSSNKFSNSYY